MIVSNISDYHVPKDDKKALLYFADWQLKHGNDHINFYNFINGILSKLNKPLLKPHKINFGFNIQRVDTVNEFLRINDIEHKEMYRIINDIGALATPAFYARPILNMTMRINKPDIQTFGQMLFHENRVHTITSRALNLLTEALNVQL